MANVWKSLTALGHDTAQLVTIGPYVIAERCDIALASLALRRGQQAAFEAAAKELGVPLPPPACHQGGPVFSAFWVTPDMWFVEADFAQHEDIAAHLKAGFDQAASITEQTDAWVRFDVTGAELAALLERLSNLDFDALPQGYASRTVIEHLGVYLIKHGAEKAVLYGPRSSAQSLLHALHVAALSVV